MDLTVLTFLIHSAFTNLYGLLYHIHNSNYSKPESPRIYFEPVILFFGASENECRKALKCQVLPSSISYTNPLDKTFF